MHGEAGAHGPAVRRRLFEGEGEGAGEGGAERARERGRGYKALLALGVSPRVVAASCVLSLAVAAVTALTLTASAAARNAAALGASSHAPLAPNASLQCQCPSQPQGPAPLPGGGPSPRGVWYAQGSDFHGPAMFPLCSMDACFNFSRCLGHSAGPPLVFSYTGDGPNYFRALTKSKWYTRDPSKACFFFVFLDARKGPPLRDLPFWGASGHNHVLLSFSDSWSGPPPASVGMAKLVLTAAWETLLRPSFDVAMPLPRKWTAVPPRLPGTAPTARKYLLTFMGNRYLGPMRGRFRSSADFRALHNARDAIVLTHCGGSTNARILREQPELRAQCEEDRRQMRKHSYADLMNSTFGLAPAGRQASTYRFLELLSAGVIPVVVADNWKKPFDDIILWGPCLISFPTAQLNRILPTLRQLPQAVVRQRHAACSKIYEQHLSTDEKLLQSVMDSLSAHFFGAIP